MNERIKERILSISSKEEFDKFISNVKMSTAPVDVREEIIEEASKLHPDFSEIDFFDEVKKDIDAGMADIDDISAAD